MKQADSIQARVDAMKARHGITDEDIRWARKWSEISERFREMKSALPTAQEFADNWAKLWDRPS